MYDSFSYMDIYIYTYIFKMENKSKSIKFKPKDFLISGNN